jgi:protein gp37
MGKDSRIEWTDHTFNPWWGCVKVSDACKHCYAEAWAKRTGQAVWGIRAPRRFFGAAHWLEPLRWNREAEQAGERRRGFCASMADVFEDRRDLDRPREQLAGLIAATPALDWLLLTKRPEHVCSLAPWGGDWPPNVWLGTTAEMQRWVVERLPILSDVPAHLRFVSCEPLLGPLDLTPWLGSSVHWVIAGGESGSNARPTDPLWFRSLRDQCQRACVPFHFKQWGNWSPAKHDQRQLVRTAKKTAGRVLDGRTWDQLPA